MIFEKIYFIKKGLYENRGFFLDCKIEISINKKGNFICN